MTTVVMTREERIAAAKRLFTEAAHATLQRWPNAPDLAARALRELELARMTPRDNPAHG